MINTNFTLSIRNLLIIVLLVLSSLLIACKTDSNDEQPPLFSNAQTFLDTVTQVDGNFTVNITDKLENDIYTTFWNFKIAKYLSYEYGESYDDNKNFISWAEGYWDISSTHGNYIYRNGVTVDSKLTATFASSDWNSSNNGFLDINYGKIISALSGAIFTKNGDVYTLNTSVTVPIYGDITSCKITISPNNVIVLIKLDDTYNGNGIYDYSMTFSNFNLTSITWPL